MSKAKVRPVVLFNWFDHPNSKKYDNLMHHSESLQLTDRWEDNYGSGNRQDRHYWHARREFLKSYHLSSQHKNDLEFTFKEKLRRSVKEINEVALEIVSSIRKGMSKRRIGLRVYRIKVALPSWEILSVGCFTPWLYKIESSLVD
ncbi:uncharacterized protein LOC123196751 [Mangifera indica]|uniref:uncharacterized protein LOC123196751 n=1 Tax=Mangifera indica TaxID=29780 RepID=UPI001CFB108D|nr:uncharacterized protein LOC123196751 [Mangifera indica]